MNLCFVVDSSGSIKTSDFGQDQTGGPNFAKMKTFMKNLVNALHSLENHKVGVAAISYSNVAQVMFNLTYDKNETLKAVDDIEFFNQNTNTSGALRLMRNQVS